MQDRIKEHDRDIRLSRTETTAVSEHAHNTADTASLLIVTLITRSQRGLTDNINRDSGIEIPEALMPTIKKYNNRRAVRQQTAEGANH